MTAQMPSHLTGTPMEKTWNDVVALATAQGVDPSQPIDVSSVPAEEIQSLVAVGAAEVTTVDGKPMASLKYMEPVVAEDMSGAAAASKKHTFAT